MSATLLGELQMVQGDSLVLTATITDGGTAVNITGASMWFTAKSEITDADASAVFQKTVGSGITLTTPASGIATIELSPSDTAGLADSAFHNRIETLYLDLQMKNTYGQIFTVWRGTLKVYQQVTEATT